MKALAAMLVFLALGAGSLLGADEAQAAVRCGGHAATVVGTSGDDAATRSSAKSITVQP
jgi:hypothetical protein